MPALAAVKPQVSQPVARTADFSVPDAVSKTILPIASHSRHQPKTSAGARAMTLNTFTMDVITPAETEMYVTAADAKALAGTFNKWNTGVMGTTRSVVFDIADGEPVDADRVISGVFHAFAAERQAALQTLESQYGAYVSPADRKTVQSQKVVFALDSGMTAPS